jgi:hypothetical protein
MWHNDLFTTEESRVELGVTEEQLGKLLVRVMVKLEPSTTKDYFQVPESQLQVEDKDEIALEGVLIDHVLDKAKNQDPGFLEFEKTFQLFPGLENYDRGGPLRKIVPCRRKMIEHLKCMLHDYYRSQSSLARRKELNRTAAKKARSFDVLMYKIWEAQTTSQESIAAKKIAEYAPTST